MMQARGENKKIIYGPHYGCYENNRTIHSTSNVPIKLLSNQMSNVPMPNLTKPTAVKPGTIITFEVKEVKTLQKFKIIPKIEIDAIKYDYPDDFELGDDSLHYISIKDGAFENVLKEHFSFNKGSCRYFIQDL